MALPEIPAILTNTNWQTQKGIVAKLVKGESGIGALMDALGVAYKAVTWTKFDGKMALGSANLRTAENIDKAQADAKTEYTKVEPVRKAAYALRDRAKTLAETWKKNPLLGASVKHLEKIQTACETLAVACKSMDMKSFDELRAELVANEKKAHEMLPIWITAIKTGAAAVNSSPDIKTYNEKLYQKIRGLGTSIGGIPALKTKWAPIWGNTGMSGQAWIADATTPEAMKTKVKTVLDQLAKFEVDIK